MALWQKLREEKRAEVWSGRIVITILECTFPEENVNGACSGKKHHPVARVMYMIEYEPTTMSVRCSGAEIWLIHGFSRNMEFGFFDSYSLWDDI